MAVLSYVLGGVLGKYFVKQVFDEGLTRDLGLGVFGWAQQKLGREKALTLDKHCNDLTEALLADAEEVLVREGASRDQLRRMGQGLAGVLEAAEPSRLVTENAYNAKAVTAAIVTATPEGLLDHAETELYASMAGMIAKMLVKVGPALMDYEARSEEAKFRALAALGKDTGALRGDVAAIRETLEVVERSIGDAADVGTRRRNLFIKEYRAAIRLELDYVEILGLDRVGREQGTAKLSVAYLSLTGRTGEEEVDFESLLADLVVHGERVVIEGGAGSGKSTLLRWAASEGPRMRHLHRRSVEPTTAAEMLSPMVNVELASGTLVRVLMRRSFDATHAESITPYLIRLRQLEDATLPNLEDFARQISTALTMPPPQLIADTLRNGHAILMFDGVDEVPEGDARDGVLREIGHYAKTYPKCPIIVATRPNAFDPAVVDGLEKFERYLIDDLSPDQQALFIDRWHLARADVAGAESRTDFTRIAEQLKERFRLSPQLSLMASSPLLCAAVCALHERQPETLPDNERDLVEALTLMLLRRDIVGGRTRAIAIEEFGPEYALGDDKRLALLGHLAAKMVRSGLSQLDLATALQTMPKALKEIAQQSLDSEKMLQALVARSGVLRPCSRAGDGEGDAVEFVHNRFKEWLASVHLIGADAADELSRNADREDFAEVCVFAAAAPGNKAFAERLIAALLERAEQQEGDERRTFEILAFRASMAATTLDEKLRDRIETLQKKLLPPKDVAEAKALAQAGDDIVDRLKQSKKRRGGPASIACIRCLGLIGTPKALAVMETWLDDTRIGVIREIIRHMPPHEVPNLWRSKDGVLKLDGEFGERLSRLPEQFPEAVTSLNLSQTSINDIATITALPELTDLSLGGSAVTDLAPLSELSKLESLDVSLLGGEVLHTLPAIPSLRALNVTHASGVSGVPLKSFPLIRELEATGSDFRDLSELAGLSSLESLYLSFTPVDDVAPLADLLTLRFLDLSNTEVTDISTLEPLARLEYLDLSRLTLHDISPLAALKNLKDLHIEKLPRQNQNMNALNGLTNLTRLSINRTPVEDLDWLAGLTNLLSFSANSTGIDSADLDALPRSLRQLDIGLNPIDDLSALRNLQDLHTVTMIGVDVLDLSPLADLENLSFLTCDDKSRYSDTPPGVIKRLDAHVDFIVWGGE